MIDAGKLLQRSGYRIKIFNTINFKKSMHYNPFAYIHSEKDILKLVTTLISNTKGEQKGGDEFWTKAETLLYCALIQGLSPPLSDGRHPETPDRSDRDIPGSAPGQRDLSKSRP